MLFIDLDSISFPVPGLELDNGVQAVLFAGNEMARSPAYLNSENFVFERGTGVEISPAMKHTLFAGRTFFEEDDLFYGRFLVLVRSLRSPAVVHVKEKPGAYLRLIACRPRDNVFIEKYAGWETWSVYKKEFDRSKKKADDELRYNKIEKALGEISRLGELLGDLMKKTGLEPEMIPGPGRSALDIYYGRNTALLPFEALFPDAGVTGYFPGVNGPVKKGRSFTLVYTEKLEKTSGEIQTLRSILKDNRDLEIYSDRQFSGGNPEIRSGFFHFAGHGHLKEGKVSLDLGPGSQDPLFFKRDMELAFLNCCHAGSTTEGVLSALFERGTRHVIASPYGIPDGFHKDAIGHFYRGFTHGDIDLSYRLTSLKYPSFRPFYRHFRSY